MAVITGFYANLTRSVKLIPWPGGHEVLFVATSDRLPSHPTKDGRATESCFALIGAIYALEELLYTSVLYSVTSVLFHTVHITLCGIP